MFIASSTAVLFPVFLYEMLPFFCSTGSVLHLIIMEQLVFLTVMLFETVNGEKKAWPEG